MKYPDIQEARFITRLNRFAARVEIDGNPVDVHVKNTGRCRELLINGSEVYLTAPGTPGRKTVYDLVAVRKGNGLLVNMDSQAPNVVVREWLDTLGFDRIVPEHSYGDSRMDFYMEYGSRRFLMEVKGCTLEIAGTGYFPDAPTERGVRHLMELVRAVGEGYTAVLTFVIQMDGIREVRPNVSMHPEFGEALEKALKAGVQVVFLECHVEPDSLTFKHVAREITAGWFK